MIPRILTNRWAGKKQLSSDHYLTWALFVGYVPRQRQLETDNDAIGLQ